jgi:hypothetical protein
MTALSALSRANGHGVLAELLAQIRDRSEGGLAGDLGERISRESEVVEVAVIAMLEVPLVTHFCVLCRLRRTWWGSCGEKK